MSTDDTRAIAGEVAAEEVDECGSTIDLLVGCEKPRDHADRCYDGDWLAAHDARLRAVWAEEVRAEIADGSHDYNCPDYDGRACNCWKRDLTDLVRATTEGS